jgi:hypothetical protein
VGGVCGRVDNQEGASSLQLPVSPLAHSAQIEVELLRAADSESSEDQPAKQAGATLVEATAASIHVAPAPAAAPASSIAGEGLTASSSQAPVQATALTNMRDTMTSDAFSLVRSATLGPSGHAEENMPAGDALASNIGAQAMEVTANRASGEEQATALQTQSARTTVTATKVHRCKQRRWLALCLP